MNIDIVKEEINTHIGDEATIKCNLGRNKVETYNGIIKNTYNHIFTIETNNTVKSFSYSDVITKTIRINYKKIAI